MRKCEKAVLQKILGPLRRLAGPEIGRARDELMPVRQDLASDERRILQLAKSKRQVDAFGDEVHAILAASYTFYALVARPARQPGRGAEKYLARRSPVLGLP
jgi:hypothetical protein